MIVHNEGASIAIDKIKKYILIYEKRIAGIIKMDTAKKTITKKKFWNFI